MSKIKISELQVTKSELNQLSDGETSAVVGGNGFRAQLRNDIRNQVVNNVQVINNVSVQVAIGGGDNVNVANLTNGAGISQS